MIGIICEFNPFHQGHQYLLDTVRQSMQDEAVLCVMSGNFVQRGEPALYDKWTRTRMALSGGADLVAELPTYYASATAEHFSFGAVSLLKAAGLVDTLAFGMEDPSLLPLLQQAAKLLTDPDSPYETRIREYLKTEASFAAARSAALSELLGTPLPSRPNEILALEYLSALNKLDFHPALLPVKRTVPHALSASLIRERAAQGEPLQTMLPFSAEDCRMAGTSYTGEVPFIFPESVFPALRYRLAFHTAESLSGIDEVGEGLENRILQAAAEAVSYEYLVERIHSKRYPTARIRRILLNVLLDITTEKKTRLSYRRGPGYLQILGLREGKENLLGKISRKTSLPLVLGLSDALPSLPSEARQMLEDELRFSRIYRNLYRPGIDYLPPSELSIPIQKVPAV